jgi:hypothetical protein
VARTSWCSPGGCYAEVTAMDATSRRFKGGCFRRSPRLRGVLTARLQAGLRHTMGPGHLTAGAPAPACADAGHRDRAEVPGLAFTQYKERRSGKYNVYISILQLRRGARPGPGMAGGALTSLGRPSRACVHACVQGQQGQEPVAGARRGGQGGRPRRARPRAPGGSHF